MSLADWIKIFVLSGSLVAGWFRMDARLSNTEQVLGDVRDQTTRMEHYLESSDTRYWKTVRQNGDARK